jgi:hypothetical protein
LDDFGYFGLHISVDPNAAELFKCLADVGYQTTRDGIFAATLLNLLCNMACGSCSAAFEITSIDSINVTNGHGPQALQRGDDNFSV